MEGQVYILKYSVPYVRTAEGFRSPHPDDFCHGKDLVTGFFAQDMESAERQAREFLSVPLKWAGIERFPQKTALYPAPTKIEFDIAEGNVPISSLD